MSAANIDPGIAATKNIIDGSKVFLTDGLPASEYMAALALIQDGLGHINKNPWRYGNFIRNLVDRFEDGKIFDHKGHDEALAEIARLLPFSYLTIDRLISRGDTRTDLINALVISYANQFFDIESGDAHNFNRFFDNLLNNNLEINAIIILDLLAYKADDRFDSLKEKCLSSALSSIIDGNKFKQLLASWLIDNSENILKTTWGCRSISNTKIEHGIELYQVGLTRLGSEIMRTNAKSASCDELIVREKLTGIVPSKSELCSGKKIPDIPLMSYILWTHNPEFDTSLIKDRSFKGPVLNEALTLAKRHSGGSSDEVKNERIKLIARNVTPQAGLTDVLDRFFFPNRGEHEGFIREVLMQNLAEHHDEILSISIIAKMMARHKIELDTSSIVHKLNKALVDELALQRNMTKYLCLFTESFISLFSESTVIDCLNQASARASKSDLNACQGIIPSEIIMKSNGLKRHHLMNDLSL